MASAALPHFAESPAAARPRKITARAKRISPPISPEQALRKVRAYLDGWDEFATTKEAQIPRKEAYVAALGEAETVRLFLDFLAHLAAQREWNPTESMLEELEQLGARTDDLIDTLSWAAQAEDELASLAEAEAQRWEERFDALPEENQAYFAKLAEEERRAPSLDELP